MFQRLNSYKIFLYDLILNPTHWNNPYRFALFIEPPEMFEIMNIFKKFLPPEIFRDYNHFIRSYG